MGTRPNWDQDILGWIFGFFETFGFLFVFSIPLKSPSLSCLLLWPKNIAIAFLLNSSLFVPYADPKLWIACCWWPICSGICGARLLYDVWFWCWCMNGVYVPIFWAIWPLLIDEGLKPSFGCCCCWCSCYCCFCCCYCCCSSCWCICYCRFWIKGNWTCELLATELTSFEEGREKWPEIMAERFNFPDVFDKKGLFWLFIWLSSFLVFLSCSFATFYYSFNELIGELLLLLKRA